MVCTSFEKVMAAACGKAGLDGIATIHHFRARAQAVSGQQRVQLPHRLFFKLSPDVSESLCIWFCLGAP